MSRRLGLLLAVMTGGAWAFVGCGPDFPELPNGPHPDASTNLDGGDNPDASSPVDASVPDASLPPDASIPDASVPRPDASVPDASVPGSDAGWTFPAKPYLDSTVTSFAQAYGQDTWNERMKGIDGVTMNPFFTSTMFGCTDISPGAGQTVLSCSAPRSEARSGSIRKLVLHNTLESLPDTVSIFHRNTPYFRTDRSYPVSIHHVVGRDGTVVDMVPHTRVAYHAGNSTVNAESVGIEIAANVANDSSRGHTAARTWNKTTSQAVLFSTEGMTLAQYRSLLGLVDRIRQTYGLGLSQVLSHKDVSPTTSCPGSIWKTTTIFANWKSQDLDAHVVCMKQNASLEAFARCIK